MKSLTEDQLRNLLKEAHALGWNNAADFINSPHHNLGLSAQKAYVDEVFVKNEEKFTQMINGV